MCLVVRPSRGCLAGRGHPSLHRFPAIRAYRRGPSRQGSRVVRAGRGVHRCPPFLVYRGSLRLPSIQGIQGLQMSLEDPSRPVLHPLLLFLPLREGQGDPADPPLPSIQGSQVVRVGHARWDPSLLSVQGSQVRPVGQNRPWGHRYQVVQGSRTGLVLRAGLGSPLCRGCRVGRALLSGLRDRVLPESLPNNIIYSHYTPIHTHRISRLSRKSREASISLRAR